MGQNLLQDRHPEFADFFIDSEPTQTQRGVYATAAWRL